ncbi:hypothetical protein AXW67_37515 [Bradyrhizobium neotropicale]|uniref:Uncharacterized protein n=1 Tax=Bradyrhizobium neotropicale TaxID=1497615 RepID=A0A176ZF46_9BRAD|nr:hypothetical protein AXW67_37515 [Bradyrhizobium neotropicale]
MQREERLDGLHSVWFATFGQARRFYLCELFLVEQSSRNRMDPLPASIGSGRIGFGRSAGAASVFVPKLESPHLRLSHANF